MRLQEKLISNSSYLHTVGGHRHRHTGYTYTTARPVKEKKEVELKRLKIKINKEEGTNLCAVQVADRRTPPPKQS